MDIQGHGQSSSFKVSFEIELSLLDFNMISNQGYPLQRLIIQLPQMNCMETFGAEFRS